jgi:hypothetical protein
VIVTVLPHPDHADWFDLSFIYWGFITHESVESAALRVLTDFCDHNPTVVALSPFGLFPAVSPHDPAWLDCMDHLRELLTLAEPLDVTQTLARCLNVVFTLQGLRCNTAAIIAQRLEAYRRDWEQLSAAHRQLNFTLTQVQQENDRLRARRFQLELERGDRLQRIVDLEEENHALEEDADAHEIEADTTAEHCGYAAAGAGGRGTGGSLAGYSGLTATAPSTGTPGGAAGFVRSGPDEPGRTTATDYPSFAYVQWCFSGQLGCRQQGLGGCRSYRVIWRCLE